MQITLDHIRQFLKTLQRKTIDSTDLISSAVLIVLFESTQELHVIFTQRTEEVEHHKGQVSFPGGAMSEPDTSILETALRETEEEIGLQKSSVEVLGFLSDFQTPSGFRITPVVAYLPKPPSFSINPTEVQEVFDAPLSFFLDSGHERVEHRERSGKILNIYYYNYGKYEIWGATAAILRSFLYDVMAYPSIKNAL